MQMSLKKRKDNIYDICFVWLYEGNVEVLTAHTKLGIRKCKESTKSYFLELTKGFG